MTWQPGTSADLEEKLACRCFHFQSLRPEFGLLFTIVYIKLSAVLTYTGRVQIFWVPSRGFSCSFFKLNHFLITLVNETSSICSEKGVVRKSPAPKATPKKKEMLIMMRMKTQDHPFCRQGQLSPNVHVTLFGKPIAFGFMLSLEHTTPNLSFTRKHWCFQGPRRQSSMLETAITVCHSEWKIAPSLRSSPHGIGTDTKLDHKATLRHWTSTPEDSTRL